VVDALSGESALEREILERHQGCLSVIFISATGNFTLPIGDVREASDVVLCPLDKSHDLVVIVLEGGPVNLGLVRIGHHLEVIIDVPFRVVEKLEVCRKLFFESFVVFEVEVDYPLKIVPSRFFLGLPDSSIGSTQVLDLAKSHHIDKCVLLAQRQAFAFHVKIRTQD